MKRSMLPQFLHRLGPLVTIGLFAIALLVIHHEMKIHPWSEVRSALGQTPRARIAAAAGLTGLGFVALIGYDYLGFRYIHQTLSKRRIALAGFVGYAFSQSLGHSLISGGSVRLRLYSGWGMSASDISRLFLFGWLTLYMGLVALGGALLTLEAGHAAPFLHLAPGVVRGIGITLLVLLAMALGWAHRRREPIRVRTIELALPGLRLSLVQVFLASLDLALAGCVLYVLLPPDAGVGFPAFLAVYLIAVIAGAVSQLPGGIGVIEGIMLSLLTPELDESTVLGALLLYRVVYTIAPLVIAAVLLAGHELIQRRIPWTKTGQTLGRSAAWLVPHALALTTFVAGLILLVSGATPSIESRIKWMNVFLPLPVIEGAHFLASIAGIMLIILARGLQLRLDAAYWLTLFVLGAGIVLSIIKGGDFEEAIALVVMLAAIAPCRGRFTRRSSVLHERFTPEWIAAIVITMGATAWLVFFAYRHVDYHNDIWWRFSANADAPRALRSLVGLAAFIILFLGLRLTRTATPELAVPDEKTLDEAAAIAAGSGSTYSYLALLGDKNLLLSPGRDAFIMYADQGRSSIAMGDPVGSEAAIDELVWDFRNRCHQQRRWPVFYQVHPDNLDLYVDLGLSMVKLGEEGRVFLPDFSLVGSKRSSLRKTVRDIEAAGCSFEIIAPGDVPGVLPRLRRISDEWLGAKGSAEKSFSLGSFSEDYIRRFPVGVARRGGEIIAFMNLWCGAQRSELSVDLMRYSAAAPDRTMEYLFCQVMLWGKGEGYNWFSLGMAPLSGLENRALAPLWNRAGGMLFRHGEHFYNFQGLRGYKQKFDPVWTPRYLASPGGLALPRIFVDVATLISGGVRELVIK